MSGIPQLERVGLMTAELLLGVDHVPRDHQRSYQEFFLHLIRRRGFPLHTASLWNALYFGWSFETNGYLGKGVRLGLAQGGKPIPVGAFVEVKLGQNQIALAEVTYKEGRDPGIDGLGLVQPQASGSRLGLLRATEPTSVREGLVLDFDAFGEGVNDAGSVAMLRAQRRRLLTEDQHLEVEVGYGADEAGLDDLALFSHYVLEQYGDSLFEAYLRDGGADVSLEERRQLLLNSIQAIEELAQSTAGIRRFGYFNIDEGAYRADRVAAGDARFGADAFNEIVSAVVRAPAQRRALSRFENGASVRRQPVYQATAALVREHLGRHGLDVEERDLLAGPSYARMVIESNLAVVDAIGDAGQGAESNVYVRLDDEWQGGGVWRTLCQDGDAPPEMRFGPLVALGMGFSEGTPTARADVAPTEPPPIERTEKGWRVPLTLIDLHHRDLRLSPEAMAMLDPDADSVVVELNDGIRPASRKPRPLDRERRLIKQMLYSADFLPGVVVGYSVGFGGRLVSVRAYPLGAPVEIEGKTVRHEFNERVLRQELRLTQMESPGGARQRSLTEMIADAFRRRGRPTEDGGFALRTEEVIAALVGIDQSPVTSGPIALRLQAGDYEYRNGEYVWFPRVSRRTSPRERIRLKEATARNAPRLRSIVVPQTESMYVRTYTRGRMGSAAKHASYTAAMNKYRMRGRWPDTLLPNQTWAAYALSRQ